MITLGPDRATIIGSETVPSSPGRDSIRLLTESRKPGTSRTSAETRCPSPAVSIQGDGASDLWIFPFAFEVLTTAHRQLRRDALFVT
jgi:hypothetical protein